MSYKLNKLQRSLNDLVLEVKEVPSLDEDVKIKKLLKLSADMKRIVDKLKKYIDYDSKQFKENKADFNALFTDVENNLRNFPEIPNKKPKAMSKMLTSLERIISSDTLKRGGIFLKNVPIISNLVEVLEKFPSNWDHANKVEKMCMLLGATMMIAGVVLLVAATINPLVPGTPIILGASIAALILAAGKTLFQEGILKPEDKKKKDAEDVKAIKNIMETMKNVNEMFKKIEKPVLSEKNTNPANSIDSEPSLDRLTPKKLRAQSL